MSLSKGRDVDRDQADVAMALSCPEMLFVMQILFAQLSFHQSVREDEKACQHERYRSNAKEQHI